jgi:hypothetical protein
MNNFSKKLDRRIDAGLKLYEFYSKLKANNNYMELEDNLENRIVVTNLQANLGALIGEHIGIENVFPTMIMSTTFPSTPLCLIGKKDLLNEIVAPELLNQKALIEKILLRSKAIEGFLKAEKTFIVLYIKEYGKNVMDNLKRLSELYPTLILKQIDFLPENLHGATYVVNEKNGDREHIFLASVITTQCSQSLKDNLKLSKIFIKNCTDEDFMEKLSALNNLLMKNDINFRKIINLDKNLEKVYETE